MSEEQKESHSIVESDLEIIPPSYYKCILLNDNYTTMEFVIHILKKIFHKSSDEAHQIMTKVHEEGSGVCGIFPFDIAKTKAHQTLEEAKRNNFPLQCIVERDNHD